MTKRFTKGETVHLFGSWDDKGAYFVRPCTVGSSGPKRTHLFDRDSGELIGTDFLTTNESIVGGLTDAEAIVVGVEKCNAWIAEKVEYLGRVIHHYTASHPDHARRVAVERDSIRATTPTATFYDEL